MPGTILVADDSPTIQRRASGILEGEGLEVVTVANGVAAIKKLAAIRPLLVLADVSMPGRDGYEVCQIIKQSPETKLVPVLLIFSDLEPYDQARGAQVGADGSVKKPFVDEELVGAVKKFTEQTQSAASPPPVIVASPPPLAPSFEAEETEPAPAPAPEPGLSSPAEGMAFASDVPVVEPEPILHEAEPLQEEPAADHDTAALRDHGGVEPYEPPVEVFEAYASETEQAEPQLVEEPMAPLEETHEHPHPHTHEAIFHSPGEIAEPVLADELESAPPSAAIAAEPVSPPGPEVAPERVAEAGSLATEQAFAAEPSVIPEEHVPPEPAEPEAEAAAVPEVVEAISEPVIAATEPGPVATFPPQEEMTSPQLPGEAPEELMHRPPEQLSRDQVHRVVREVVVKMSPPALSSAIIEDLAQRFTDEILAGLD